MTIQERIIKIRTDAELSQADFGNKLNIGNSSVSLLEPLRTSAKNSTSIPNGSSRVRANPTTMPRRRPSSC